MTQLEITIKDCQIHRLGIIQRLFEEWRIKLEFVMVIFFFFFGIFMFQHSQICEIETFIDDRS